MNREMGEPFMGTGKSPEGYKPGDYVECSRAFNKKWAELTNPKWSTHCQYRLEADHPYYMPPIWCLDKAAQLAGRGGWSCGDFGSQRLKKSIIAHARTLQNGCEPMQKPVDPLVEALVGYYKDAEIWTFEAVAAHLRARFGITEKAK